MKSIWLLRHAKTETGGSQTDDHDRALTDRGIADAQRLGRVLAQTKDVPQRVLCSTSLRTRQTLEHLALSETVEIYYDEALYLASAGDILATIQACEDSLSRVMIIGHNPGLHHLALMLGQQGNAVALTQLEMGFPTCAYAKLRVFCDNWQDIGPDTVALESYEDRHMRAGIE